MLVDAALNPLYQEGEPIEVYKWVGKYAEGFDPEVQNAWADLPMKRADIKDPDVEFRGEAPKDLSKSCDKTNSCKEEVNAWDYLPEKEEKTLATHKPSPVDPAWEAWSKMPLNY